MPAASDRAGARNTDALFDPSMGTPGGPPLPPEAASKLRQMRNAADDIDTARRALTDRRTGLIGQREDALSRLRQLSSSPEARLFNTADNPASPSWTPG